MKKTVGVKVTSLVLAVLMLVSVMFLGVSSALADDTLPRIYSAIRGYTQGTKPSQEFWHYDVQDFSGETPFGESDESFKAPQVTVLAGSTSAELAWEAVDGATEYEIAVYEVESASYVPKSTTSSVTANATVTGLEIGKKYAIQIIATKDAEILCNSVVLQFTSLTDADNFVVVNDASDLDTIKTSSSKGSATATPDGAGLLTKAARSGAITFGLNKEVTINDFQAIAYWVDFERDGNDLPEYYMTDSKTENGVILDTNTTNGSNSNVYLVSDDGEISMAKSDEASYFGMSYDFKGYVIKPLLSNLPADTKATSITLNGSYLQNNSQIEAGKENTMIVDNLAFIRDLDFYFNKDKRVTTFIATSQRNFPTDNFTATGNMLSSSKVSGAAYLFYNNTAERDIRFRAFDNGMKLYGFSTYFSAPMDSTFDFGNTLKVMNNSGTGKVYYRVMLRKVDGTEQQLWPETGDWYTLELTSSNLNPTADLVPMQVQMSRGDQFVLEGYADLDAANGGTIDLNLGAPVARVVDFTTSSKGSVVTYNLKDYRIAHEEDAMYDGAVNPYVPNQSRFEFEILDMTTGTPQLETNMYYRTDWDHMLLSSKDTTGFHFQANNTTAEIKNKRGVSIAFHVYETGSLSINTSKAANAAGYFRIVKNEDEVIFPTSGSGWSALGDSVSASCEVEKGDVVRVQAYCDGDTRITFGNPTFTLSTGNTENQPGSGTYGALYERPYNGEDYKGDYATMSADVFRFSLLDNAAGTYLDADAFDYSKDNFLYNKNASQYGYHFTDDSLLVDITGTGGVSVTGGYSAAIGIVVPETGFYDISSALALVEGTGDIRYRITSDGTQIWPEGDEWQLAEGGKISATEVSAAGGSILRLEIAVTNNMNTATLSLGSPTFRKVSDSVPTATGFMTIYTPYTFAPHLEKAHFGSFIPMDSRWNFGILKGDSVLTTDTFDSTTKFLSNSTSGTGYYIVEGETLKATVTSEYGLNLEFVAPRDGTGCITLPKVTADVAGQFRIVKNGSEILKDWTDFADVETVLDNLALLEGDRITIQVKASGDGTVDLDLPSISVIGSFKDSNDPNGSAFYVTYADPYEGNDYTGEYTQKLNVWNFYSLNGQTLETTPVNAFDSTQQRFLYNSESGSGFHFVDFGNFWTKLTAGADGTPYGTSLVINVPQDHDYDLESTFKLNEENKTADVHVRLLKNDEVIWPTDGEWATKTLAYGETLEFPLLEISAVKGDVLALQVYADNIQENGAPTDSVILSMGAPKFLYTRTADFSARHVSAKVYSSFDYSPYGKINYNGSHTPMESRWNFAFYKRTFATEPGGEDTVEIIQPNSYLRSQNFSLRDSNSSACYHFAWQDVRPELMIRGTTTYGVHMYFISPSDGTVMLSGAPNLAGSAERSYYMRIVLQHAETGEEETIFPAEGQGTDGWAVYDGTPALAFTGADLELKTGDIVYYQIYGKKADLTNETKESVQITMNNPSVVMVTETASDMTSFSADADFTPQYPIGPYWSYEYALDPYNPEYQTMPSWRSDWAMWTAPVSSGYLAVRNNLLWIYNGLKGAQPGSAMYTFTVERDGYVVIEDVNIRSTVETGKVRITLNGENVWPENNGDWTTINKTTIKSGQYILKVSAGDKIRFEGTVDATPYAVKTSGIVEKNTEYTGENFVNVSYVGTVPGTDEEGNPVVTEVAREDNVWREMLDTDFIVNQVMGKKIGDTITFNYTHPTDDANTDLAGKTVSYTVTINSTCLDPIWNTEIYWNPKITWSLQNPEYAASDDIYGGLDEEMLAYFKALSGDKQFDVDYLKNKELSERPDITESVPSDTIDNDSEYEITSESETTDTTSTSSGGRVVTYIIRKLHANLLWLWILLGCVGGALIIAAIVLIVLKKKGILFAKKSESGEEAALEEAPIDISSSSSESAESENPSDETNDDSSENE